MNHLFLDVPNGHLIATNGKLITVVKVEVDKDDVSGLVSVEVLVYARDMYRRGATVDRALDAKKRLFAIKEPVFISCKADALTIKGPKKQSFRFPRPTGDFPDIGNALPSQDYGKPLAVVDADYLIDMLKSFKNRTKGERNEQVAIYVNPANPSQSVLCFAVLDGDSVGLVMPIDTLADPMKATLERVKISGKKTMAANGASGA
jgi:hypothetical protein